MHRRHGEYELRVSDVWSWWNGQVSAVGSVRLSGELDIVPFRALHRLSEGLILAAYHCLDDPEMIDRLGLIV